MNYLINSKLKMNFFLINKNLVENKSMSDRKKMRAEKNKALSKTYREVKRLGGDLKSLGLKAYNSKGAEEVYDNFFKEQRALGLENATRKQLWDRAKELGYEKRYRNSNIKELNKFIRDKQSDENMSKLLDGEDWKVSFEKAVDKKFKFTDKHIKKIFDKALAGKHILKIKTKDGGEYYLTVKSEDFQNFKKLIKNYFTGDVSTIGEGSDSYSRLEGQSITGMTLVKLSKPQRKKTKGQGSKRKAVGWFPYLNGSGLDLTRYQIFSENDDNEDVSCLLHSLKLAGIIESKLMEISSAVGNGIHITQSNLALVCDVIEKMIVVRQASGRKVNKYGTKYQENGVINLGEVDGHFFINEETKYTGFYIKNMDALSEIDDEVKFSFTKKAERYKYGYRSLTPKFLSSLELIMLLKSLNYFVDYRQSINPSNLYTVQPHLHNIDEDQQEFKYKERKPKDYLYFVADTESDVISDKCHQAIAIAFKQIGEVNPTVLTIDKDAENPKKNLYCRFMNAVKNQSTGYDKVVMYFHNAKYDCSLFDSSIPVIDECSKAGALYSKTYNFYGLLVEVRDSFKYFGVGGALRNLPKMLGFDNDINKGEAINYNYHTTYNMTDHWIKPEVYAEGLKKYEQDIFYNIKEEYLNDEGLFNPTKYYLDYLKLDVDVLAKALTIFRELIYNITDGMDAFQSLTISSIGHKLAIKRVCYCGVYQTKGGLRDFIQQAVRGGRVYANPEYVKTEIEEKIQDFDGVSLYPSAMKRLCEEYGIAVGRIYKGTNNFNDYKDKSYYIVKILVKKLGKKVQVPLVSVKEGETLKYSNDLINQEIFIDKYALEDLIQYQEVEFDVIEGIYWNNGYNTNLGKLAEELHRERCKHKNTNPALANVLKLLMNSIYGKTAMKRSDSKITYIPSENFDEYLYQNFGTVKEISNIDYPQVRITQSDYDNSFSLNHVAVSVLSTSKRIMNEVFHCMDECKMPMYYTDTDSIHMLDKDVKPLSEKFTELYGKELIGKSLGQFHTDFEMKGCDDVFSTYNITLGPKSYFDILKGTDSNGKIQMGTHIRLKGITEAGINKKLLEYGNDSVKSAKALFNDLKDGKEIEFILNPSETVSMYYDENQVKTRDVDSFRRNLKF